MLTSEKIILRPDDGVSMTTFVSDFGDNRPALVVLPGGAYAGHAAHEGDAIAIEFLARGFNCFTLYYTLRDKAGFPRPLQDVSAAIVNIRDNAAKYRINPDRIFVIGFSAGGHLAGAIATMWDKDFAKSSPDMPFGKNRPTAAVLCYPCITADENFTHECVVNNRGDLDVEYMSLEKQVSENSVPAFIWHNSPDKCVPSVNSLLFALEYAKRGIPYEIHTYDEGAHGMSLANGVISENYRKHPVRTAHWVAEADGWMHELIDKLDK